MNFKIKCLLQKTFSMVPKGEILNYIFQRYLIQKLPVSNDFFLYKAEILFKHFQKFNEHNALQKNDYKYYEFGAGWDLMMPLAMGAMGYEVECIDIRKLVFNDLILDSINKFNKNIEQISFPIKKIQIQDAKHPLSSLQNNFKFNYSAPLDARNTKFQSDYFDFATSNATFEHIPAEDLILILNETFRILKPGGILSLIIDYQDHWFYFDKKLSAYNFLKYSEKEWKKYNPSLHYQNRLRHKDYLDIISKTDFQIMEIITTMPSESDIDALQTLNINEIFKNYTLDELSIKGSHIVLRKN